MTRTGVLVERTENRSSIRAVKLPPANPVDGDTEFELLAAEILPLDVQISQGTMPRAVFPLLAGQSATARNLSTGELVYVQGGAQGMGISRPGTFATSFRAANATTVSLTDGLDPLLAAAGLSSALCARLALFESGGYHPGEVVLVLGASGAVGLSALQLAKSYGSEVVGVSRDPAALGQSAPDAVAGVTLCTPEQMGPSMAAATRGAGPDVVIDCLGGQILSAALTIGAAGCRHVVVGYLAGLESAVSIAALLARQSTIVGFNVHMIPAPKRDAATSAAMEDLSNGTIKLPQARTYSLEQAAEAYGEVGGRQRVLLVPHESTP